MVNEPCWTSVETFNLPRKRSVIEDPNWTFEKLPHPPSEPDSIMKGIFIISLCAFYTLVLFSCVAVVKSLAILVMGQPLNMKTLDFKKRDQIHHYDYDLKLLHDSDSITRYVASHRH